MHSRGCNELVRGIRRREMAEDCGRVHAQIEADVSPESEVRADLHVLWADMQTMQAPDRYGGKRREAGPMISIQGTDTEESMLTLRSILPG